MQQCFGGELQGIKPPGSPRPGLEDDIKMDLKEIVW